MIINLPVYYDNHWSVVTPYSCRARTNLCVNVSRMECAPEWGPSGLRSENHSMEVKLPRQLVTLYIHIANSP